MVAYKFHLGIELSTEGFGLLAVELGLFVLRAMDLETVTAAEGKLSSGSQSYGWKTDWMDVWVLNRERL
jgi:hypothetical protein